MTDKPYNLATIRDLLLNGFDDRELRRLCHDVPDFRPVYNDLAQNTGKADIVDKLLDYAERQLLMDTLLALAKDQNPSRYDHHGPYYIDDPTPHLQKQVSDLAKRLATITAPTSLTDEQQYLIALHWDELGRKDSLKNFDLTGCNLAGVVLEGANLAGAVLTESDLGGANLAQADLRGAELTDAYLGGAILKGANLRGAILNANLRGADLRDADLTGAYLGGVDLTDADLTGASVSDRILESAGSLDGTTWPDGKVYYK